MAILPRTPGISFHPKLEAGEGVEIIGGKEAETEPSLSRELLQEMSEQAIGNHLQDYLDPLWGDAKSGPLSLSEAQTQSYAASIEVGRVHVAPFLGGLNKLLETSVAKLEQAVNLLPEPEPEPTDAYSPNDFGPFPYNFNLDSFDLAQTSPYQDIGSIDPNDGDQINRKNQEETILQALTEIHTRLRIFIHNLVPGVPYEILQQQLNTELHSEVNRIIHDRRQRLQQQYTHQLSSKELFMHDQARFPKLHYHSLNEGLDLKTEVGVTPPDPAYRFFLDLHSG